MVAVLGADVVCCYRVVGAAQVDWKKRVELLVDGQRLAGQVPAARFSPKLEPVFVKVTTGDRGHRRGAGDLDAVV